MTKPAPDAECRAEFEALPADYLLRLDRLRAEATKGPWRAWRQGNSRLAVGGTGQSELKPLERPYDERWIGYRDPKSAEERHRTVMLRDADADYIVALYELHSILLAALARSRPTVPAGEVEPVWLIERAGIDGPEWWCGVRHWSDALNAVHFVRKRDAEQALLTLKSKYGERFFDFDDATVTEHIFDSGEAPPGVVPAPDLRFDPQSDPRDVEVQRAIESAPAVAGEPRKPDGVLSRYWERALEGYRFVVANGLHPAPATPAPAVLPRNDEPLAWANAGDIAALIEGDISSALVGDRTASRDFPLYHHAQDPTAPATADEGLSPETSKRLTAALNKAYKMHGLTTLEHAYLTKLVAAPHKPNKEQP